MLFNSYVFIFVFLPLTIAVYHLLRGNGFVRMAIFSLVVASLVFYGWWSLQYLGLLLALLAIDLVIAHKTNNIYGRRTSGESFEGIFELLLEARGVEMEAPYPWR